MPISFQELDAWAQRVPRGLQPWEFLMLRRLSLEWIAESQRAEDADAPAPWDGGVTADELKAVTSNLRAAIKRMAA